MATNNDESKKGLVRWHHLLYWGVIFIILTIFFWTMAMNESDNAIRLFSFAATITSIVLAVVSIVFSIVSGFKTFSSVGSMQDASEKIGNVSHDLMNIKNALNTDITKLSSLEKNVNSILCANEDLSKHISKLLNSSQQTQREVQDLNELLKTQQGQTTLNGKQPKKTSADFDKSQYTIAACIMIYACALTQKEGNVRHFPLDLLISEQWSGYLYGYAYSMKGLLGKDIFDVEIKDNKTMHVITFSSSYFKGVNKEELFSNEVLTAEMNKRLTTIEQYFKEHRNDEV